MILPPELSLIKEVREIDMQQIEPIMKDEDLSTWDLLAEDFLVIKNKDADIVSFGRIHEIENNCKELSSLRVDPDLRGHKIGIYLSEQLISSKKGDDELYLATKTSLGKYYKKLGFEIISLDDAPSRFQKTASWARENSIDFIIMKYKD